MSLEENPALPHGFGERVTMTIKGLSKVDKLIFLVFGENKKSGLLKLFEDGPIEELPARFIKDKDIARKTIILTDQRV